HTVRSIYDACETPAAAGEFRVYNQFTEQFSVKELAEKVQKVARDLGNEVELATTENPRVEKYDHYHNAVNTNLLDLGLEPHLLTDEHLTEVIKVAMNNTDRV